MPIKVTCSNCGGVLHAPDDAGGKRGRCPTCGNILPIPAAADAPKASMGNMPEPAGRGGARPPSFGDFALGGPESIPIGSVAAAAGAGAAARASIPGMGEARHDPRKASTQPAAEPYEPRRPADPFARKGGMGGGDGGSGDGAARGWAAAKSGLWWVGFGVFFYLLPALALPGWVIADHFKKGLLPDGEFPGLKLPYATAVPALVAVVPLLLGSFCMGLGRFGLGKAPKRSGVGGLAALSGLTSLVLFGGVAAVLMPSVWLLANGETPILQLMQADELPGIYQRFALFVMAAAVVVGEFWFGSAVGRVGAALGDRPTAARSTRYLLLLGLVVGVLVSLAAFAPTVFHFGSAAEEVGTETSRIVSKNWEEYVRPQLAKLGEYEPLLKPGLFLLGGLLLAIIYYRLIGASRGAIREWLEVHGK